MRSKLKYYLNILICFTISLVSAQPSVSFQQLSKKDGLSQASVFAIAQDSTGFMWFGTRDGLNKYDGYQFKVFKNTNQSNSLVANDIRILYVDPKSKDLWIGTNTGLGKYNQTTDNFNNFFHYPADTSSISNNVIRRIFRDTKDRLWIGTADGINLYDESTKAFKRLTLKDENNATNKSDNVTSVIEDSAGVLWFGTGNGLFRLNEKSADSFCFDRVDNQQDLRLSDSHIMGMLEDRKGNFWIATFEGGINYWDQKKQQIRVFSNEKNNPQSLSHNNVRSICLDGADNLWIGTFDGLNFLGRDATDFVRINKSEIGISGLSDKSIKSVFIDQRGSLWVGTYYGGIDHLDENYDRFSNFKYAPVGNVVSGNVVSSFAEDTEGNLWIGTEGDGLNFYDIEKKEFNSFQFDPSIQNTISGNNVKQLLLDGEQLWIGTFKAGLNVLDIPSGKFKHYKSNPNNTNSLSTNNVYGLMREGKYLWILTYGGGLDILDLENDQFYNYSNILGDSTSLSSDLARVFLKTKDQLWIGTEHGLNKVITNKEGFPDSFESYLSSEMIYSLHEDANSIIWIGTFTNGFYRFDPSKDEFIHYTVADGLPGSTVFGILEVSDSELWLSTNNGLSKFNPILSSFTNYSYSNGLENAEYNFNAYYKTAGGQLLFGGINGFTLFDPSAIQANEYIPPVVFTRLSKNNETVLVGDDTQLLSTEINSTESITFNYTEANFSISFAALDYFSPENNHYSFMLEGIDREWTNTVGKTEATYTIQREGEYIFRLKGGNSDGVWNPTERQIKIIVLPPLWRTWWAYFLYVLATAAIIFGLIRFLKLKHKLQLEQIVNQKQEELHEVKLRFFTNITHEFRTPLTLILAPLNDLLTKEKHSDNIKRQLSSIERNAQRLLNLVNQVLTFRKLATDHEPLRIVQGNIVEFLKEIFLPFQETANLRRIKYEFHAEENSIDAWFDQDKLERVFFNLLSNAFKFTPDEESICIIVAHTASHITIQVKDTGVGIESADQSQIFKRFYEKSDSKPSSIKGSGIGLAISKQMVALHRGDITVDSKQDNGHKGTTFTVSIPKGRAHFKNVEIQNDTLNSEKIDNYQPVIATEPEQSEAPTTESIPSDAAHLLIVEDNPEVREYIAMMFSTEYQVSTAINGKEGLAKAKKILPSLIISDVMMPEMDGISFCGILKSDLEISHIPVVLLTARTASLFKIEGLRTGADDYITKPFNPDELRLRVRNIIKSRVEARAKFARTLSFDPKEISITSADETFLETALQIVEKEIGNYEFNINQFAFDLAVSRPLLFTKLKALTGQTPNNFIKTIRLKRATQLLKSQKLNISEVAYKVGFKDAKYFRKCFKDQFKILPSQYKDSDQ